MKDRKWRAELDLGEDKGKIWDESAEEKRVMIDGTQLRFFSRVMETRQRCVWWAGGGLHMREKARDAIIKRGDGKCRGDKRALSLHGKKTRTGNTADSSAVIYWIKY